MKLLYCPRCNRVMPTVVDKIGERTGYFCQLYGHWIRWLNEGELQRQVKTMRKCSECNQMKPCHTVRRVNNIGGKSFVDFVWKCVDCFKKLGFPLTDKELLELQ